MLILLIADTFFIPLQIGFKEGINVFLNKNFLANIFFNHVTIGLFIIDSIFTLNSGYYSKGVLVTDKFEIFKWYAKSNWLLYDFTTIISNSIGLYYKSYGIEIIQMLRIIKLLKISRIIEESLQLTDKKQYVLQLIKLTFLVVFINHLCACLWHLISVWQIELGSNRSWLSLHNLVDESYINRYINAAYYSVLTMITAGIINTNNDVEKFISIIIVLVLAGIFAYAISTIGIILQDMNKNESELK